MEKQKSRLLLGVFFGALVLLGFLVAFNVLDPDVGWHLKTGELILERGVPQQDWFSYTMPNFPWINHEWLIDVLMFWGYSLVGIHGLTLFFIIAYTAAFFIYRRPHSFFIAFLPILLGYSATLGFLGIRPQLITILLFAVLLKVIDNFWKHSSKLIYATPLLFLIWANLHGGFFVGLAMMALIFLLELLNKEKQWQKVKIFLVVLVASTVATLINPYGWRIYQEIFTTIGDHFARSHLIEWLPLFLQKTNMVFVYIYVLFFGLLLFKFFKKISFRDAAIALILLLLSLGSMRYFLVFVIWTVPLCAEMMSLFNEQYQLRERFLKMSVVSRVYGVGFCLVLFSLVVGYSFMGQWLHTNEYYPEKALAFIEKIPASKNMFNDYGWGGYLIWRLPERKVFIDGRMAIWRDSERFVFGDYIKIIQAQDGFEDLIKKYNIGFFVLPIDRGVILIEKLRELGWKEAYKDNVVVVLEK